MLFHIICAIIILLTERIILLNAMKLKILPYELSVCKLNPNNNLDVDFIYTLDFYFLAKTDDEISIVCKTADVPSDAVVRDDGWCGFYFDETLDFSLIGILSKISAVLAENNIGIFVVSTYNTDYILVKSENYDSAVSVLKSNGYTFLSD